MNPEDMENKWKELDFRLSSLEAERQKTIDMLKMNKLKSAQQQLADQYRRFSLIGPILGLSVVLGQSRFLSLGALILIAAYFCIAGAMDAYLCHGIKSIDLGEMGVEEVAAKARRYKRIHHYCQVVLIAMCIPVLICMFSAFPETYYRWGMIAGIGVGLAVGLSIYLKMMRNYKDMID
ncbi:MAG: hypothetical protein HDS41_03865 [Bacteroides sp.]|nr:hypothetical protein [Bacteroides sp.]